MSKLQCLFKVKLKGNQMVVVAGYSRECEAQIQLGICTGDMDRLPAISWFWELPKTWEFV
jgi:hypothetical protein